MKEFALKHPWLTVLLVIPSVIGGVVGVAQAIRAPKTTAGGDEDPFLRLAAAIPSDEIKR